MLPVPKTLPVPKMLPVPMADTVKFTSSDEFENWLKDKPIEWAQALSARIALRVLPLSLLGYHVEKLSSTLKEELINSTARASLISWAAREIPAHDIRPFAAAARAAAFAAADAAADATATATAARAAARAAAATATADATARAAFAAFAAADAAAATNAAATNAAARAATAAAADADLWFSISNDANYLDKISQDVTPVQAAKKLISAPLWLAENGNAQEPEWAAKYRQTFFNLPIKNHHIWQIWYDNILAGNSPFGLGDKAGETLTLKIATQENEFWEQDLADVNGDILGWYEEALGAGGRNTQHVNKKTVESNLDNILLAAINLQNLATIAKSDLEANKPNGSDELTKWDQKFDLLKDIENKLSQLIASITGIENQNDIAPAVERSASVLGELISECEMQVRENKSEIADWFIRLPVAIGTCGLASLAGAYMPIATPLIFGAVGGKKVYDLVKSNKKPK